MRRLEGFQKGVDLGGWLSQGKYDKEHLDTFITEKDIERIASWGLDHVRVPVDFENIETEAGEERPEGYVYLDHCISWCRKYGLNMVLDLHKTCGYIFDDLEYSADFFTSKPLQDRFIRLWERLAERYAKDSDIVMFELLNEIVRFDVAETWNEIALRCIRTIRSYAPTAKILYGGVGYNAVSAIKLLLPPTDENIVYNFHCYEPLIFTHQSAYWVDSMPQDYHIGYPDSVDKYMEETKRIAGAMTGVFADPDKKIRSLDPEFFMDLFQEAVEVAEKYDIPLYCGEYGVIDRAPGPDTVRWFADIHAAFEHYGIGRAVWTYKQLDFGLIDDHYKPILPQLIKLL